MKKVDVQEELVSLWQGDNCVVATREFVEGFGERFIVTGTGLDPNKPITRIGKIITTTMSWEEIEKMNKKIDLEEGMKK